MSSFFTLPASLARFVLARAADVNDRVDAIGAGFDAVEAVTNRCLRPDAGTMTALPNSATRAGKSLVFDGSGNPGVAVYLTAADVATAVAAAGTATAQAAIATAQAAIASISAGTATTQAGTATTQAGNAAASAAAALVSEGNADTSEALADTSRSLANEWATKVEDSAVTGYPGQYSALHHSAKANAQRVLAEAGASTATAQAGTATTQAGNAAASASAASGSASAASASAIAAAASESAAAGYAGSLDPRKQITDTILTTNTSVAALVGKQYILTAGSTVTVTLPSSPIADDCVMITVANGRTDTRVVPTSGIKIDTDLASTDALILDNAKASIGLRYADSTLGWRFF